MINELTLLLIYFSGRLIFFNSNTILSTKRVEKSCVLKRISWGVWSILFVQNFILVFILFLIQGIMVLLDSYIRPHKNKYAIWFYLALLIQSLTIWPWALQAINLIIPEIANPIVQFFTVVIPVFSFNSVTLNLFLIVILGYLLILKEATIFIRLILNRTRAVPRTDTPKRRRDEQEYERGKIIGVLERSFYYFLILTNNFGGIAIIVALKSLARFKELDNKEFAEYFLIGSLLSLAAAVFPAAVIQLLM